MNTKMWQRRIGKDSIKDNYMEPSELDAGIEREELAHSPITDAFDNTLFEGDLDAMDSIDFDD